VRDETVGPLLPALQAALRASWTVDTCDPHVVETEGWSSANPARGQCGTKALVVQDYLGGDLLLADVRDSNGQSSFHYWYRLPDGTDLDLTRQQFAAGEVVGIGAVVVMPDNARTRGRCIRQYQELRDRTRDHLGLATYETTGPTAHQR